MTSSQRRVRGAANFSVGRIYSIHATGTNFIARRDLLEGMLLSNAAKSEEEVSALFACTICHARRPNFCEYAADAYK